MPLVKLTTQQLVRRVATVGDSVAHPGWRHTTAAVFTLELDNGAYCTTYNTLIN